VTEKTIPLPSTFNTNPIRRTARLDIDPANAIAGTYTLSRAEGNTAYSINATGTLTEDLTIMLPDVPREYWVGNSTTDIADPHWRVFINTPSAVYAREIPRTGIAYQFYYDGTDIQKTYGNMPVVSTSSDHIIINDDVGKLILHPDADHYHRTYSISASLSGFEVGDSVEIMNESPTSEVYLDDSLVGFGAGTVYRVGDGAAWPFSISPFGRARITKMSDTVFWIDGTNVDFPPADTGALLLETGDHLLLETGDRLMLE